MASTLYGGLDFPSVVGAYHNSLNISTYYGKNNVLIWADLDNLQDIDTITARITEVIADTESWLNSRLRRSRYTIPFTGTIPKEIIKICSLYSGATLYEPRSQEDFTSEAGQATKSLVVNKMKRAETMLREILAGRIILDAAKTGCEVPTVYFHQSSKFASNHPGDSTDPDTLYDSNQDL